MPQPHKSEIPVVTAPTVAEAIEIALRECAGARVARLETNERRAWIKQREQHESLRKRLHKGDARHALLREAENLRALAGQGVRVPEVIASSEAYLVISDSGSTVTDILYLAGARHGHC